MQEYTNDLGDSRMRQHHLMSWIFKMSRKLEFNTPQERNSMTRCFQVPVKISTADSSSSTKTKCSNEYHIDKKTTYLAFQSNKHFFFGEVLVKDLEYVHWWIKTYTRKPEAIVLTQLLCLQWNETFAKSKNYKTSIFSK